MSFINDIEQEVQRIANEKSFEVLDQLLDRISLKNYQNTDSDILLKRYIDLKIKRQKIRKHYRLFNSPSFIDFVDLDDDLTVQIKEARKKYYESKST